LIHCSGTTSNQALTSQDAMNNEKLVASTFAEIVASQHMDANKDHGNSPCYKTCKSSGQAVSDLLVKKLH